MIVTQPRRDFKRIGEFIVQLTEQAVRFEPEIITVITVERRTQEAGRWRCRANSGKRSPTQRIEGTEYAGGIDKTEGIYVVAAFCQGCLAVNSAQQGIER